MTDLVSQREPSSSPCSTLSVFCASVSPDLPFLGRFVSLKRWNGAVEESALITKTHTRTHTHTHPCALYNLLECPKYIHSSSFCSNVGSGVCCGLTLMRNKEEFKNVFFAVRFHTHSHSVSASPTVSCGAVCWWRAWTPAVHMFYGSSWR